MATSKKKTVDQLRWQKRKDAVNKKRRDKRAKAASIRVLGAGKIAEAFQSTDAALNQNWNMKSAREAYVEGQWGEVKAAGVDPDEIEARAIIITGRKKNGVKNVKDRIADIRRSAKLSATAEANSGVEAKMRGARSMMEDRIISAFMARVELTELSSNGIPPAIVVSGLEVAKVVDALRSAGYSSQGRHGNRAMLGT